MSQVAPLQSAFVKHSTHLNVLGSQTFPFPRPAQLGLDRHWTQTIADVSQ